MPTRTPKSDKRPSGKPEGSHMPNVGHHTEHAPKGSRPQPNIVAGDTAHPQDAANRARHAQEGMHGRSARNGRQRGGADPASSKGGHGG